MGHCAHCKASTDITDVGAEAWQNLLLLPLLPPPPCSAPTAPCRRPGGASQHVAAFPLTDRSSPTLALDGTFRATRLWQRTTTTPSPTSSPC